MKHKYIDLITNLLDQITAAFENYNSLSYIKAKSLPEINPIIQNSVIEIELSDSSKDDRVFVLDSVLKNQFERAFDADLSDVKIHTSTYAEKLAKENDAEALTIGNDIYFSGGKYIPETEEGIGLLAHEIQHVIQNQENQRMVYLEDMQEIENEALKTENIVKNLKPYNIETEALVQSDISKIDKKEKSFKSDQLSLSNKKYNKPFYEIILKSGEKIILSIKEHDELYQMFIAKVKEYINDIRIELTEEEYDKKMFKIIRVLRV